MTDANDDNPRDPQAPPATADPVAPPPDAPEYADEFAIDDSPAGESAVTVKLEMFEGPLDLLIHLVRKNEYDIFDIPIAAITEQYLRTLDVIKSLNLDVAGEFILMAATLMKIKSRTLLPPDETGEGEEEDGEDPRALLAAQLAEYMRYKEAAEELSSREQLDRDLFARKFVGEDRATAAAAGGGLEVSIFELMDAFGKLIAERKITLAHTVVAERVSVAQRIHELLETLQARGPMTFQDLFAQDRSRIDVIVTFLALLEVMRLSLARAYQAERFGPIHISLREAVSSAADAEPGPTPEPEPAPASPQGDEPQPAAETDEPEEE
jgi:segregation and condensation protein A